MPNKHRKDIAMRTQDEIVNRIEACKDSDFFGFERAEYLPFLDFEHVKPYLKDGVTTDQWKPEENNRENILSKMLDYMPFAWDKAIGCRGISASRSISHYEAWVWLLGDEKFNVEYEHYGKDILRAICERYGWNPNQWDDGIRINDEDEIEDAIVNPALTTE